MNELMTQDQIKAVRLLIQNFHKLLNMPPNKRDVVINKYAGNSKYLPISFLEMNLDEMFFGLWQTKNFEHSVIANEVVCSLELEYFHPSAQTWLTRVGVGAAMIQFEAEYEMENGAPKIVDGKKIKLKTNISDISKKITNTLTKDFPHAKAQAFRNACLSIGKSFGRDLNREYEDTYNPIIKDSLETKIEVLKGKITVALDIYQGEDKDEIQEMCVAKTKAGEFNEKFAKEVLKTLGVSE